MDQQAFDRLTRLFGQARTRRESIGALLGVAIAGFAEHSAGAKSGGKRHGRRDNDERGHDKSRAKRTPAHGEQVASGCYSGTPCVLGKGKNNFQCDLSGMDLSGKNLSGSNLSKANFAGAVVKNANLSKSTLSEACFAGADLTDVNLKGANTSGAIFCRTVMPDGSVNDSGCAKGTTCCPTCLALGEHGCRAGIPCCAGVCGGDDGNACVCPSGTEECNGSCRDLQTDRKNCGACGHRCSGIEMCSGGRCACVPGNVICNDVCLSGACCNGSSSVTCSGGATCCSPNGCKNVQSDANNCGICGLKCTPPEADGCTDGTCSCGGGPPCTNGQVCDGGNCQCPANQELCKGVCQFKAPPGQGCGACGTACPDKEICAGSPLECQCAGGPTCTNGQVCDGAACICADGGEICGGACTVCPPPPSSGGIGLPKKGFCCEKSYCSCNGECCKDDCFWTYNRDSQVVDEFCCSKSGGVVCGDQCCKGPDCGSGCIRMNPAGGSYRRPGRG